jgi:hypothetical protein
VSLDGSLHSALDGPLVSPLHSALDGPLDGPLS